MIRRLCLALLVAGCGGGEGSPDARPPDARIDARPDAPRPDAQLAACGIEEPGSRCAAADRLERCDGTQVVSETCNGGRVCGTNPATGSGAACIEPGGACGEVGLPTCSGAILTMCEGADELRVVDCASLFATCTTNAQGTFGSCSTVCTDQRITAEGSCVEGRLRHCVFDQGAYSVVDDACPEGTTCTATGSGTGLPGCATAQACGGLSSFGACDGKSLRRCTSGQLETVACAEVCAWDGERYGCVAAASAGARGVSGTATYDDREPFIGGLEPPVPRPVRGAGIVVIDDASGLALASGATADDGSFALRFDAAPATAVRLLLVTSAVDPGRPAQVMRPDGLLLGATSSGFPAADDAHVDLHVTEAGGAAAFNILDTLTTAFDVTRTIFAASVPPPVTAVYAKGGSSIQLSVFLGSLIRVLGAIEDDDGYDDAVLAHEFGHYVENHFGDHDNPGGRHAFGFPSPPPLAWSEGFASYFGGVMRGDPIYVDTNLAGGFGFDLEEDVTEATSNDQRDDVPENTVAEILWDLGDAPADDDDPARGPHSALVRVEDLYFRANPVDRGDPGLDFVDFLDGYLLLQGAGRCAELRAVVASRDFPYDFAGPVSCPLP